MLRRNLIVIVKRSIVAMTVLMVVLNVFSQKKGLPNIVLFFSDEALGKVCDQLRKLGLEDNTLIIYTNDNSPFGGCKTTYLQGGIRVH